MTSSENIVEVTETNFQYEVLQYSVQKPVVVDFWAEWCDPCKILGPLLEKLVEEANGQFRLAKVDVDANQNAAMSMGVRGIPALFIFKDGEVISNRAGAAPKAALQKWIEDSI